jgi:Acyl-CoA carboxylase epsilon subunit
MGEESKPVVLRVVKGEPTPEELAALVAVVSTRAAADATAAAGTAEPERASDWASYWRNVRRPLPHGPGEWRASGLPRC